MKPLYYDLFELMSREHGLTLLDTEMQEIVQVCLEIEKKRQEIVFDNVKRGET